MKSFKFDDVAALMKGADVKVGEWNGKVSIELDMRIPLADRRVPVAIRNAIEAEKAAEKKLNAIRTRQSELHENRVRIRNEMLRVILEQTPAGRRFLGELSGLRIRLEKKGLMALGSGK